MGEVILNKFFDPIPLNCTSVFEEKIRGKKCENTKCIRYIDEFHSDSIIKRN